MTYFIEVKKIPSIYFKVEKLAGCEKIQCLQGHSAVYYKNSILVFGGENNWDEDFNPTIYMYDIEKDFWSSPNLGGHNIP